MSSSDGDEAAFDPVSAIIAFVQRNPLLVFAVLYFIYNKWKMSQPWPDYGGRVTTIHTLAEWDALLDGAGKKVVVVDAYALWCPPCKTAAPVYAKLSDTFSESSCIFAKVNVDEARDVAKRLGISAMPTFKFFKDKAEVAVQQGWGGEAKMTELLKQHGATEAKKD